MKFLYFSFQMPIVLKDSREIAGGAAVQWLSWIGGFLANGHEFGVLTWQNAVNYINKKLDFDIVESYDPKHGISNLRIIYYQLPRLYFAIKNYKPDFVIQSSATAHTGMLMLVCRVLKIPFIHRVACDAHIDERLPKLLGKKDLYFYKLGLRYADYIFAQNSYQYGELKLKFPNKKIHILHNPYNEIDKMEIQSRRKREYIAWVGNFREIKNLPALARIASKLTNINFKIAGAEHSNLDQDTRAAIEELKQLKNVEFVGYLTRIEIQPFLSKSIALLNTSYNEGFSNTFLEAWALGVPVITTKNVNPDEIVSSNNVGKVADDYEQLAGLIKEINSYDETEYTRLSLRCYEYVKKNHDPKILAEKFVSYLIS